MKRLYARIIIFLVGIILISGCASQQVQKPRSLFSPSKLQIDHYQPKVENFVVIWDTSSSMSDEYSGYSKFRISKDYLNALNQTIPEMEYSATLRTFVDIGSASENSSLLVYGPTRYSTAGFESALKDVNMPLKESAAPLVEAISATGEEIKSTQGTTAIIILSDGINMDQMSVEALQNLKDKFGDRVCIYPIRIGDDPIGVKHMKNIADTGACGFPVVVVDHKTSYSMGDLVVDILLSRIEKSESRPAQVGKSLDSDGDGVPDDIDKCPNTPKGVNVDERGCWTFEAVVLFDFDKTEIKSEARPILDEASNIIKINSEIKVEVAGHTDNIGTAEYNMDLSERRADAVMKYFIGKGIDPRRLTVNGYGLTKPVANNDTKEGRAKNRRVELTIVQ